VRRTGDRNPKAEREDRPMLWVTRFLAWVGRIHRGRWKVLLLHWPARRNAKWRAEELRTWPVCPATKL
jgi:hypothetical protein